MKPFRVLDPTLPGQVARGLCALAVMTKAPQAGWVKTRLVPPLTPDEAAELNKCFLRDTAAAILNVTTDNNALGIAAYTPAGSELSYTDILPTDFSLLPQRGDKFGERLYFAAEDLIKCGFESVCLIDSDSPTVPTVCFAEAANALAKRGERIVLGPSDDGGYYLIGMKRLYQRMFEEIDWSTDCVFDQTLARAAEIGLEVKLLPTGYDVDDWAALKRLCDEVLGQNGRDNIAPNTRRVLKKIIRREGFERICPRTVSLKGRPPSRAK